MPQRKLSIEFIRQQFLRQFERIYIGPISTYLLF